MKKMIVTMALAVAGVLWIGLTTATTQTPVAEDAVASPLTGQTTGSATTSDEAVDSAADALEVATDATADTGEQVMTEALVASVTVPDEDQTTDPEDGDTVEATPLADDTASDASDEDMDVSDPDLIEVDAQGDLSQGIEVASGEEDLITLTLDDVPLQDVVRMFTRLSGANIVAGTNLTGSVTVSLNDVAWRPAMEVILNSVDMVLVERADGIYMVMSEQDIATAPMESDTVFLDYTTVSNILPVVQSMLVSTNASVAGIIGSNGLVIQETAPRLQVIKETLKKIDKPREQVYIEAKFVELNESLMKDIGVDWEVLRSYSLTAQSLTRDYSETRSRVSQDAFAGFNSRNTTRSDSDTRSRNRTVDNLLGAPTSDISQSGNVDTYLDTVNNVSAALSGRNFDDFSISEGQITLDSVPSFVSETMQSAILSADDFQVVISALEENDGVSIVSNPKVVVANGETALIHVGRNQPNIVAMPTGDTGDRFAYSLDRENPFIEIGVKVEVTPTVNTQSNITVRITPELSRLLGFQEVGVAGVSFPITQIRKIDTEFNLKNDHTAAIGGLTENSDQDRVKQIPLLGSIPVIGKYLFSHRHMEELQDEVVIFVTVGMANPHQVNEITGVPQGGRLIHQHLAQEALDSGASE